MRRRSPSIVRATFLLLAVVWFGFSFLGLHKHSSARTTTSADLSQLIARVETKPRSVSRIVFDPGSLQVSATLAGGNVLKANYPSDQSALSLQTLLERKNVDFAAKAPSHGSALTSILVSLLPLLILVGVWLFVLRRMRGGAGGLGQIMSFGKHKATRLAPDVPKVGFKDVAGVDEAVEELREIKEFLADPRRFQALGARIPKGVLLYGPPPERARRCSHELSRARQESPSSRFPALISSRCSSASARAGCATCSRRPKRLRPASCSSTSSTRSVAIAAPASVAATTSASRHSISCSSRWTASRPTRTSF